MSGQNDAEGGPEETGPPKETNQHKSVSKVVRVLTVLAYLLSVSMAAILLSVYYLCVWKSPVLSDLDGHVSHQHAELTDYQAGYMYNDTGPYNFTGGSSTTINDTDINTSIPTSSATVPDDLETTDLISTTATEAPTPPNSTTQYNETTEIISDVNDTATFI